MGQARRRGTFEERKALAIQLMFWSRSTNRTASRHASLHALNSAFESRPQTAQIPLSRRSTNMRAWPGLDRIIASLTQCWLQNVLRPFGTGPLHHRQSGVPSWSRSWRGMALTRGGFTASTAAVTLRQVIARKNELFAKWAPPNPGWTIGRSRWARWYPVKDETEDPHG